MLRFNLTMFNTTNKMFPFAHNKLLYILAVILCLAIMNTCRATLSIVTSLALCPTTIEFKESLLTVVAIHQRWCQQCVAKA